MRNAALAGWRFEAPRPRIRQAESTRGGSSDCSECFSFLQETSGIKSYNSVPRKVLPAFRKMVGYPQVRGDMMLVNVDIVTAFDQSTGHRSRYVLSSADESATEQSITFQDGTGAASEICLRLIEGGRTEDFHAAIRRSIEEPGAPQRLGSIEIDEEDRRSMIHLPVAS